MLSSVKYQKNKIIIHTDQSVMPKNKNNWSHGISNIKKKQLVLTYWMNLLQNLNAKTNIFVTLNSNKINQKI